jgi:GntR family transcriptional regulator, transcriptional repressor for pyruvate dehydrogenase complex
MSSTAPEPVSLVQQAMQAVRDHIRDNDMKVGDTLPGEGQFAAHLGVSRAVMREAFGALAALRQIDVANGRRAKVGAIDGSVMASSIDHAVATSQLSIADVWEVRQTLEVRMAELAATNRTDEQAAEIIAIADAMADAGDDMAKVTACDVALHEAIAKASGNPLFLQIIRSFGPLMRAAVPAAWKTRTTEDERNTVLARHRALAQMILERDAYGAKVAMGGHFDQAVTEGLRRQQR